MGLNIEHIISSLVNDNHHKKRIEHIYTLLPQEAIYKDLEKKLPKKIEQYLEEKKIRLYSHQSEAIEKIRRGENVLISTSTSSGKTLCFNLPVFESLIHNTHTSALYIYPTKALSNDQLQSIKEIESYLDLNTNANIYDGDTSQSIRRKIRNESKIILTNPYELHLILPFHSQWKSFFQNLKFIVIDEIHEYRGVFGSNVALLIRRLKRICQHYEANPNFILSSATIANPKEFGEELIGEKISLINQDGSPKSRKHFIFYNPFFDGIGYGGQSAHLETKDLFKFFISHDCQTLCFTVSRRMAELIINWTVKDASHLKDKIASYRAGYISEERREIENYLKKGILHGITSTNALELGIDIRSLDCVLISGYPGTIISTLQQAGRAGRRNKSSVVVLIAFENPLDQYIIRHPEILFEKIPENAIININNEMIRAGHILCASAELPFVSENEKDFFGNNTEEILNNFIEEEMVKKTHAGYIATVKATDLVPLDSISDTLFKVLCNQQLIETIPEERVFKEAHKGAVYFHKGETYLVKELDEQNSLVILDKRDVDYYTEPIVHTDLIILNELHHRFFNGVRISFGNVEVQEQVTGYEVKKYDKIIGIQKLDYKPRKFKTQAFWYSLPEELKKKIHNDKRLDLSGGIHGVEHAMIGIMPLKVMCDRWDLGGISYPLHPQTETTTIFIYENFEGGIGLTKNAFESFEELTKMTYELIKDCKCEKGCPACIYSPKCGNKNLILHKETAKVILEAILTIKKC